MSRKIVGAELQRLARLGAVARLEELRQEEAALRSAFPDLDAASQRGARASKPAAPRSRRPMSAAERKAVSTRMRKYWADRRKARAAGR